MVPKSNRVGAVILALLAAGAVACGGATAPGTSGAQPPAVQVVPPAAVVAPGGSVPFTATVTGTIDTRVTWKVVEAAGGTVDASGAYDRMPDPSFPPAPRPST